MKLFLLATIVATVCYVNAGKTQRLLAALNAGMLGGMNGGMLGGLNGGGLMAGMNGGMLGGLNGGGLMAGMNGGGLMAGMNGGGMMAGMNGGGMANGAIPRMMAVGQNPAMVAGGGAGFFGQPQFAQIVPGVPAFAVAAPIPNAYNVPAVNAFPFMGAPQLAPMNPPQQPLVGNAGGAMQQQLPVQPDPLRRFRRQLMRQSTLKAAVDTQIRAPTETPTTTPCDGEGHHEDN